MIGCRSQWKRTDFNIVPLGASIVLFFWAGMIGDARAQIDAASLEKRVGALNSEAGQVIKGHRIAAVPFIQNFYRYRTYRPVWTTGGVRRDLQDVIAESWIDGLRPADFHNALLGSNESQAVAFTQLDPVEREIVQTDALVRLLYQLYFGKVAPDRFDSDWNFERKLQFQDPIGLVSGHLDKGSIKKLVDRVRLDHPYYLELRSTLQAYIEHDIRGGWPSVKAGRVLKPGMSDERLALLRQRLAVTGQYTPDPAVSVDVYDDGLLAAVKRFQRQHAIDDDGVIGPATLAALNVSAQQRVDQIRANLERARWVLRSLAGRKDLVLVNIAGFYLRVFLDGKDVWRTGVITGRPYHKTPVFTKDMLYVVLNPDWTVPRSIIRNEIFPRAKADPSYLSRDNYKLVSQSGKEVAPQSLNWPSLSRGNFPFRVVQRPGPKNALGLVKFIFPNKHNVYLHDTPSRQLFQKTGRAFSHGCIRVQDPLRLAEIVLGDRAGWSRQQIDAVIASRKMKRVDLPKKLTVAILYWTVDPMGAGQATFYNDIYGRDARLIKALNSEFRPRSPR